MHTASIVVDVAEPSQCSPRPMPGSLTPQRCGNVLRRWCKMNMSPARCTTVQPITVDISLRWRANLRVQASLFAMTNLWLYNWHYHTPCPHSSILPEDQSLRPLLLTESVSTSTWTSWRLSCSIEVRPACRRVHFNPTDACFTKPNAYNVPPNRLSER